MGWLIESLGERELLLQEMMQAHPDWSFDEMHKECEKTASPTQKELIRWVKKSVLKVQPLMVEKVDRNTATIDEPFVLPHIGMKSAQSQ